VLLVEEGAVELDVVEDVESPTASLHAADSSATMVTKVRILAFTPKTLPGTR
jgi:hypothetical protein